MGGWDVMLELVLLAALAATLLHGVRLHRALAALRLDRGALQAAVDGFDGGTRQAEAALARMERTARDLSALHERGGALRDDLAFLSERADSVADRLDGLVRTARTLEPRQPGHPGPAPGAPMEDPRSAATSADAAARSQAERNLLVALQGRR